MAGEPTRLETIESSVLSVCLSSKTRGISMNQSTLRLGKERQEAMKALVRDHQIRGMEFPLQGLTGPLAEWRLSGARSCCRSIFQEQSISFSSLLNFQEFFREGFAGMPCIAR